MTKSPPRAPRHPGGPSMIHDLPGRDVYRDYPGGAGMACCSISSITSTNLNSISNSSSRQSLFVAVDNAKYIDWSVYNGASPQAVWVLMVDTAAMMKPCLRPPAPHPWAAPCTAAVWGWVFSIHIEGQSIHLPCIIFLESKQRLWTRVIASLYHCVKK